MNQLPMLLTVALICVGCLSHSTDKQSGGSHPSDCEQRITIKQFNGLPTQLKCSDVSIIEFEPVSAEQALIHARGFKFSARSALADLGPAGISESPLNSLLSQYGELISISNVHGGQVVILMGESAEKLRVKSLTALLVNVSENKIISKVDLLSKIDSSNWFSLWQVGQQQFKTAFLGAGMAVVSGIPVQRFHMAIDFNKGLVSSRTVIAAEDQSLFEAPILASAHTVESNDFFFSATSLTRREYLALLQETNDLTKVSWPDSYLAPVVYATAKDGSLVTSTLLSEANLVPGALAVSGNHVAVFATRSNRSNEKKPVIALFLFHDTSKTFELLWQREYSVTNQSDAPHTAVFWEGHGILMGGSAGFSQAETGSVLVPSDAFLALIDIDNGELLGSQIIVKTKNDDAVVMLRMLGDHPFLWTMENAPITHEKKTESTVAGFYKVESLLNKGHCGNDDL